MASQQSESTTCSHEYCKYSSMPPVAPGSHAYTCFSPSLLSVPPTTDRHETSRTHAVLLSKLLAQRGAHDLPLEGAGRLEMVPALSPSRSRRHCCPSLIDGCDTIRGEPGGRSRGRQPSAAGSRVLLDIHVAFSALSFLSSISRALSPFFLHATPTIRWRATMDIEGWVPIHETGESESC